MHTTPASPNPYDFRRILFCTDFSTNAHEAFGFALGAARRNPDCELILLHVLPEPEAQFWKTYIYEVENVDAKARADIDAKIDGDYRTRIPEGVSFRVEIRIGNPAQQILLFARDAKVDLVVLGRQGHGAFEKLLFGNVAGKVARRANCPILIVPKADAND